MSYCPSTYQTQRRKTREVKVGKVGVGGENPIRIQSMTTSPTHDVDATVDQILRLEQAGCEIARVTVQGKREAAACEGIKNKLIQLGCKVPLVADIHFYPPAALLVADFVDKIRVNPGNFVDRRATFRSIDYNDESYAAEIQKIEEKFIPLVDKCKTLGRAMRIGTNHGSLSDRIMNRYGDSPEGMVESALEFARICRDRDYHDFLFSMKASNPVVMVQAYRLLVARMMELEWDYPLHLGVTEAGSGQDGRVKSAIGIGTLLLDGLGDTIRVSLTEDPWCEIDPCQRIIQLAQTYEGQGTQPFEEHHRNFQNLERKKTQTQPGLPLHKDGTVICQLSLSDLKRDDLEDYLGLGSLSQVDAVVLSGVGELSVKVAKELKNRGVGVLSREGLAGALPLYSLRQLKELKGTLTRAERFQVSGLGTSQYGVWIGDEGVEEWDVLLEARADLMIYAPSTDLVHRGRRFHEWLGSHNVKVPLILEYSKNLEDEDFTISSAAELGALLSDGIGQGVCVRGGAELGFSILQGCRMRSVKTEYISCPGCGRTLFDLQEVTAKIQEKTQHLPGVKIAVMGCIVNGPGEMADADFGYVGSAAKKIDLYVGKERVERNIAHEDAVDRLVELLKAHGVWVEPEGQEVR